MKNYFKGWWAVFDFTFRQSTKRAGFQAVTCLITIAILAGSAILGVVVSKPEKEDIVETSTIQKVYILDNSGLSSDYIGEAQNYKDMIAPFLLQEVFGHITFEVVEDETKEAVIQRAGIESEFSIVVTIERENEEIGVEGIIPDNSQVKKGDVAPILSAVSSSLEIHKLLSLGIDGEQLGSILKPVVPSFSNIGEDSQDFGSIIKMIATMIFGFLLYMMLLMYGQAASKSVSTEKTSKLVETLLTSVHPYALIGGKVLAVCAMAIIQFVLWLAALIAGVQIGGIIAERMYGINAVQTDAFFGFIKANVGASAFTVPSIILGIAAFFIGFLFYSMISGMTGAMVSKPEDAASVQGIFTFPIVFSFLAAYFISMTGSGVAQSIIRYIPFTAPFVIPVDILIGSVGLLEGVLMTALLLVFTLIVVVLSGKIYKGFILYNGQKISFKVIGGMIKENR